MEAVLLIAAVAVIWAITQTKPAPADHVIPSPVIPAPPYPPEVTPVPIRQPPYMTNLPPPPPHGPRVASMAAIGGRQVTDTSGFPLVFMTSGELCQDPMQGGTNCYLAGSAVVRVDTELWSWVGGTEFQALGYAGTPADPGYGCNDGRPHGDLLITLLRDMLGEIVFFDEQQGVVCNGQCIEYAYGEEPAMFKTERGTSRFLYMGDAWVYDMSAGIGRPITSYITMY